ncbi:MAG: sugar ABC transporter substrate-binding protein [Gluconacetobacter diazotrophicus]|nr:sugar ABC transporter substrate-binding protein [Gluconacetobacter diazotrophicus]
MSPRAIRTPLRRTVRSILLGTALLLAAGGARGATTLNYWMWDPVQEPAYRACIADFTKAHPDIAVTVTQIGWDDYWTRLTTAMVSGDAPDVFADHVAHYPELVENNQIVDIAPLVARDHVPTGIYLPGLLRVWNNNGKLYGLPKDWDTIAVVYNARLLKEAGVDPASLSALTWNPTDGGSFGTLLRRLTHDAAGHAAGTAGFDPGTVKQYGLVIGGSDLDAYGQTTWSSFAVSNGFSFNDGPWSQRFHYDSPALATAVQWLADQGLKEHTSVPMDQLGHGASRGIFAAGRAALTIDGSWMSRWFKDNTRDPIGFAPLPAGPQGRRTMFNGLADSIYAKSPHREEAWTLLRYLASPACETKIGSYGIIFPAIPQAAEASEAKQQADGIDTQAFVSEARPGITFPFPVSDHASEIQATMKPAMDAIFLGQTPAASALGAANSKVNQLFE